MTPGAPAASGTSGPAGPGPVSGTVGSWLAWGLGPWAAAVANAVGGGTPAEVAAGTQQSFAAGSDFERLKLNDV